MERYRCAHPNELRQALGRFLYVMARYQLGGSYNIGRFLGVCALACILAYSLV